MILSAQEVSNITQAPASKLNQITALIPVVQGLVIDYCCNHFINPNVSVTSANISFAINSIDCTDADFITGHYFTGDNFDVSVRNSRHNDGIHLVKSLTESKMTMADDVQLVAEAADRSVTIFKIDWPQGLKLLFARMVYFALDKQAAQGQESFRLGDWSVKYSDPGAFPKAMVKSLNQYRSTRLV